MDSSTITTGQYRTHYCADCVLSCTHCVVLGIIFEYFDVSVLSSLQLFSLISVVRFYLFNESLVAFRHANFCDIINFVALQNTLDSAEKAEADFDKLTKLQQYFPAVSPYSKPTMLATEGHYPNTTLQNYHALVC